MENTLFRERRNVLIYFIKKEIEKQGKELKPKQVFKLIYLYIIKYKIRNLEDKMVYNIVKRYIEKC